jgi:hypothetical protein
MINIPMSTLFDFSRKISELKRQQKYRDAIIYFRENKAPFTNDQIKNNNYLIADMITCLRKADYIDAAFSFLDIYQILISETTNQNVLIAYSWLLWSKYKSEYGNEVNDSNLEEDALEIEEGFTIENNVHVNINQADLLRKITSCLKLLLVVNNDYSRSVFSQLFNIVFKAEKFKMNPQWTLLYDFYNEFSPDNLSDLCETQKNSTGEEIEYASDKEAWYVSITTALVKLGRWQECSNKGKEGLEKITKFHFKNDIWLARKIAISKRNLGNLQEAIADLEQILNKKREWFIQKEIADLYYLLNDRENALKYCLLAINNSGPMEFKWELLYLLGELMEHSNENDLAYKHFSLARLIRLKKQWRIPQKLVDALARFDKPEIQESEYNRLFNELKEFWENHGIESGEISRILNSNERGKDGFIKKGNEQYYFRISANSNLNNRVEVGKKVKFQIVTGTEGRLNARIIRVLQN